MSVSSSGQKENDRSEHDKYDVEGRELCSR